MKEIKVTDIWNEDKQKELKDFIISNSEKLTPERKIKNELLSIKFQQEDELNNLNP